MRLNAIFGNIDGVVVPVGAVGPFADGQVIKRVGLMVLDQTGNIVSPVGGYEAPYLAWCAGDPPATAAGVGQLQRPLIKQVGDFVWIPYGRQVWYPLDFVVPGFGYVVCGAYNDAQIYTLSVELAG